MHGSQIHDSSMSKDIEQVHVNFIRETLQTVGVQPSTNNCVIYVETGGSALLIDVHVRMMKIEHNFLLYPKSGQSLKINS